ncbi:unnamed protein product [Jaminaea pallidilutea]
MRLTVTFVAGLAAAYNAVTTTAAPADPAAAIKIAARNQADRNLATRALSTDPSSFAKQKYDYIVVGAGTAGLAVAARLSESGKNSVAVLEAGPSGLGDPIIDIPGQFGADLGTKYDYNYTTDANSETGVTPKGWPRGHVLGGSSALNFLVWDAGAKAEYDQWQELGNNGWNWQSMNKYMRKSEDFHEPSSSDQDKLNLDVHSSDYGSNGPVQVSFPRYISKAVQNWIPALESLGLYRNDQPLTGNNTGASVQPSNINYRNSTRSYSATAYYVPNSARSNLAVLTNARVDKINWSNDNHGKRDSNKKASGVTFTYGGKSYTVCVKKEVIVSGGAVNSPQILELSGVGNPSILKKHGIDTVVANSNVGENLQDHTYSYNTYELKDGNPTLDSLRWNTTFTNEQKQLYSQNKPSILDETVPAIGYLSLEKLFGTDKAKAEIQKAQKYVNSVNAPYKRTLQKQIELLQGDNPSSLEIINVDGFFAGSGAPESGKNYITFLSASQHLFARGTVHIKSKSAGDAPSIQPNYYNNHFDLDLSVAGLEYLRKIANTTQYSSYTSREVVPGSNVTSKADLTAFLKDKGTTTEYHPIGSCSMLPRNQGGVVDSDLVVYGTSNVRVIDASIMPLHTSAHIQRAVYGIAERGADLILGRI